MQSEIKLALWGLGRHAKKRILPAIENSPLIKLCGICTRDDTRGRKESKLRKCR